MQYRFQKCYYKTRGDLETIASLMLEYAVENIFLLSIFHQLIIHANFLNTHFLYSLKSTLLILTFLIIELFSTISKDNILWFHIYIITDIIIVLRLRFGLTMKLTSSTVWNSCNLQIINMQMSSNFSNSIFGIYVLEKSAIITAIICEVNEILALILLFGIKTSNYY